MASIATEQAISIGHREAPGLLPFGPVIRFPQSVYFPFSICHFSFAIFHLPRSVDFCEPP
jgi:hypothetical protein